MVENIKVGDTLESVFGSEHRGKVVEISKFSDGEPIYHVKRHTDGFVWLGWKDTVVKIEEEDS